MYKCEMFVELKYLLTCVVHVNYQICVLIMKNLRLGVSPAVPLLDGLELGLSHLLNYFSLFAGWFLD